MSEKNGKNWKKIVIGLILVLVCFGLVLRKVNQKTTQETAPPDKKISVEAQKVTDLKELKTTLQYPALIVGDQQIKVVSLTGGIATAVNFDLGRWVGQNQLLVKVDDQGGSFGVNNDFASSQLKQLENALEQADENYDAAKRAYEKDDSKANKTAKDIAKLQKENAQIALEAARNNHLIKAPISGFVISKNVSLGDAVSAGQTLATISQSNQIKINFYVSLDELDGVKVGNLIEVGDESEKFSAKIVSVASQADETTRKFLVEALPVGNQDFLIETVTNVFIPVIYRADSNDSIIVPLSAITFAQNENYIFLVSDSRVFKKTVEVEEIFGENARIKADFSMEDLVVIEGNRLVGDGQTVELK